MKEAMHYRKVKNDIVQCMLCPNFCVLKQGELGKCCVRKNIKGILYSLSYEQPVSINIDKIEKKPLYHMLPGSESFSVGMAGCSLKCMNCQNYSISQKGAEDIPSRTITAKQIVEQAVKHKCPSISYTYTEPMISYEYVMEISKLARKKGLKNIIVSNGFVNKKPLLELCKHLNGANIDLKSFDEGFYKKICKGKLKPVLESLKILKKKGVWVEITNLVIPSYNDDMRMIKKMCSWIKNNLSDDVPVHFSRFYPCYEMLDVPVTPMETLVKAYETARKAGIKFVYIGNIGNENGYSDTFCPKCGERLIKRGDYFGIEYNKIRKGKCFKCNEKIPGVWG